MAEMMSSSCLKLISRIDERDQDAILARLDELQAQGVPAKRAQVQAAIDVLTGLRKESGGGITRSPARGDDILSKANGLLARLGKSSSDAAWTEQRVQDLLDEFAYTNDDTRSKAYAGFVRPEDFLRATTPSEGVSKLESENRPLDREQLANNRQPIMLIGEPDGNKWKTTGHEGRHRMMALRDAGVDRVPVVFRVGYGLPRKVIDDVYVQPQRWSGGPTAQGGFIVDELTPISYEFADQIKTRFSPDGAEVRFSRQRNPQEDTPEFKAWFKQSKAVDEDGNPMVMYHGTAYTDENGDALTEFRPGHADAIYLTPRPEFASGFAQSGGQGANVLPVYASTQNPFDYENPEHREALREFLEDKVGAEGKVTIEAPRVPAMRLSPEDLANRINKGQWMFVESPAVQEFIRANHDGFYTNERGTKNLAVFRSEQVKSATGNDGGFDAANPDIRRSKVRNPQEDTPEFKRWFGNSKLVDEDGSPQIYYHATTEDFSEFKAGGKDSSLSGHAIWLSPYKDHQAAAHNIGGPKRGYKVGTNVMPVYVKMERPLVIDDKTSLAWAREVFAGGSQEFPQMMPKAWADEVMRDGEYDGIIFNGEALGWGDRSNEVVVFKPDQIKSAIGNNGEFDPGNPDIRRSKQRQAVYRGIGDGSATDGAQDGNLGPGFYTTESEQAAKEFASRRENGRVLSGTLNASRILDIDVLLPKDVANLQRVIPRTAEGLLSFGWPERLLKNQITRELVNEDLERTHDSLRKGAFSPRQLARAVGDDRLDVLRAIYDKAGYDAIARTGDALTSGTKYREFVTFSPESQSLSDTRNDVRRSPRRNELGFYSALAANIDGINIKQAPAGAWKTALKGLVNKGAIKQEELFWTGLEDWLDLQQGKVSKQQVSEYLDANGVKVEEVVLGENGYDAYGKLSIQEGGYGDSWMVVDEEGRVIGDEHNTREEAQAALDSLSLAAPSKYKTYTLPGGENYREVLLTLPAEMPELMYKSGSDIRAKLEMLVDAGFSDDAVEEAAKFVDDAGSVADGLEKQDRWIREGDDYTPAQMEAGTILRVLSNINKKRVAEAESKQYKSAHWDQPNILAHIRVDDRIDADGKRVLFVEEVQSDWGQEGKKKGFASPETKRIAGTAVPDDFGGWKVEWEDGTFSGGYDEPSARAKAAEGKSNAKSGVPAAPFVTKTEGWLNLALKRIMAMAVDGGYDRVAFVNGEQSADRYDLSKQISGVEWRTRKVASKGSMSSRPEQGRLIAVDHDKNRVVDEEIHESRLEEYVGKEVAEKLLGQPVTETTGYGEDVRVLGGLDLKVGGEGMKTFYDRIVPNAANALLKKVSGEKLGMIDIPDAFDGRDIIAAQIPGEAGWGLYDRHYGQWLNEDELRVSDPEEAMQYGERAARQMAAAIMRDSSSSLRQPGFDVTPKLIDSATQGFTLFSRARQVNDAADYSTDILGEAIQKPKRSKPAPAAELPPGEYAVSTALVTTRKQKIGTKQVKTSQDAADALHYLTRGAVERFDAIVTNAKGKPLSIIGGFKGAVSQASVYPATIMGEAIQIPGAANIWFVHNHPSGSSDLSAADHNLHKLLSEVFDGSGITPRELLAVTPSEWSDTAGATDLPNPRDDGATVPVQEREIVRDERLGFPIESPRFALKAAQELAKRNGNRPGLMLLNARNAPVAYVPWEPAGTEILKEQGRLGSLYRAVSEANAASVILVDPMGEFGRQQWRNLAKAFKQADVRMLDVMQGERSVAETDGLGFPPEILRSKQRKDFTIEVSSRGETATAKVGSRVVGKAHAWMDSRDKFVIMNTEVREKYRRRGIASAMYRAIEEASGRQLTPAVSLSDDAFELWKSFRPEAVAQDLRHWKDQIIGARVLYRGDSGRIVKADGGTAIMEFDQPKENGSTQRVILRQNLNEALEAAGSPTIDFESASIKRSTGRTSTGAAWDSPSAEKFDDLVYKLQDKAIDTKRVVEAIKEASGAIADDLNVYLREELFHGRAAKRTEDFANMELTPLIEQLQRDGLKLGELEEYLHARHAPEANRIIAQRNPGQPGLQDGGSGMMTQDALNYMASLPADLRQKLDAAAQRVDDIIKNTRQMYVDYELESQDTINAWDNMFQHYIPLQREDKDGAPGLGQGFSIKGREAKGRTGSTRKVVDILANIALQRERAIVRGEKNRVSQALHGLAAANPNPGFWEVDVVPTERVFNPNTGLVEDRADPLYKSRENAVIAKIKDANGKVREHAVLFNEEDERAMRMAAALKNLDAAQLEGLLGVSAKISRYFASVNTSLNPVFGIVNLARDVQAALLNLSSTPLANDRAKIARYTLSAIRGIYADMRAARKGQNPGSQWAALWDDFASTGGQTGYREMFATSADRSKAIQKALDPDAWMNSRLGKIFTVNGALKVPMAQARRAAKWLFDWLSDYNETFENGVRLAAYKAGLERGLSKDQAASIAKNLTVNFNRKGQVALQAGALYAFFNASIQGTARIGQTLFDMDAGKPKTLRLSAFGKKVVYGGMLLGSMQAMLLAAAGFNDDDPPEFARERSLILPIGGGKYITIPMPLGFHVIPAIGRMTTEFALSGFKDPHKRAVALASMFADTFNPIGNAGLSMQTLAPTALDPLVALTENKDYTGKPIARESSNKAIPGHALGRDTATSMAKFLSEAVNTLSGGNEYRAGVFSPTPDQIDYLIGQATGGVGRELSKVEQSTLAVARGEALPTYKVPLVGRFVGDAKSQASEGTAFYANTERLNELETEIKGLQKDGKFAEAAELRRSRSDSYLITMANQAERQIQRLRQQKHELIKAGADREQVKAIEARVTDAMARLNRAAESLRDKQAN